MLCLSRKIGERIFIGDDVEILVADVHRGVVRLAVTAPKSVAIYREELLPADHPKARRAVAALPVEPLPPGVDLASVVADPPGGG